MVGFPSIRNFEPERLMAEKLSVSPPRHKDMKVWSEVESPVSTAAKENLSSR
jgi:hypothetical protein